MQKLALIFLAVLSLTGSPAAVAQTNKIKSQAANDHVLVQRRRIVLVRSRELAKQFPHRKRATVSYPVISGLSNPVVLRRVRSVLEFKNIFDSSLEEYRDDTWLTDFSYQIDYNRNYILDITFTQSGVGAYPDENTRHFLIDLRDGRIIKRSDAFVASKLEELASLVDAQLQKELKEIAKENTGSTSEYMESLASQGDLKFAARNLDDLSVGTTGITFLYDAGFPHVIKAFQPTGAYFFSYSQLKPYIKRDGPLGQFVK
jgi:hypothetical protein